MQLSIGEAVTAVRHHHKKPSPRPTSTQSSDQASADSTFNVIQHNAIRIDNKRTEPAVVMENNKVNVALAGQRFIHLHL